MICLQILLPGNQSVSLLLLRKMHHNPPTGLASGSFLRMPDSKNAERYIFKQMETCIINILLCILLYCLGKANNSIVLLNLPVFLNPVFLFFVPYCCSKLEFFNFIKLNWIPVLYFILIIPNPTRHTNMPTILFQVILSW